MAMLLVAVLFALAWVGPITAYIPAVPVNGSNAVQADARLSINWDPNGVFGNMVSFQLAKNDSDGFAEGALVHFSEEDLTNDTTTTPWIALINCDKNTSHASDADDIFTLARDRGATGALLYATVGDACRINDEYADPAFFDRVLDIFATPSKSIVDMILSFMSYRNASYVHYDPQSLNASSSLTSSPNMSFIIASIRAANSTFNDSDSNNGTGTDPAANGASSSGRPNPNTGLAMIILYAITGCVSGLFIIVILSGAIRAIRHPERYGPRAGGLNARGVRQGAQSTAQGLARAVLDTFPVIKFGQPNTPATGAQEIKNDIENNPQSLEMSPQNLADEHQPATADAASSGGSTAGELSNHGEGSSDGRRESRLLQGEEGPSLPSLGGDGGPPEDVQPSAMGHEICPICIVEFEEGDDVRILPCEGKHRFHKHCVDPWLLELSSSCPLCREDFHALEAMLSGNPEALREDTNHEVALVGPARSSRFARYLRFARRRHVHSEDGEDSHSGNASPPT